MRPDEINLVIDHSSCVPTKNIRIYILTRLTSIVVRADIITCAQNELERYVVDDEEFLEW